MRNEIPIEEVLANPNLYNIVWIEPGLDWEAIEYSVSPTAAIELARRSVPDPTQVDDRTDGDALLDFICIHWAYIGRKDEGQGNSEASLSEIEEET